MLREIDIGVLNLEWVLGSSPRPPATSLEVRFVAEPSAPVALSVAAYHHAVDCRDVTVVHRCESRLGQVTLATIKGRHVGSLHHLVAAGQRFSTFVHAVASGRWLWIYSPLPRALFETGIAALGEPQLGMSARRRVSQLEVFETRWARAWSLSPQVARVALLLMRGLRLNQIGTQLALAEKTVSGYTEILFERAGVCSRGELAPAALKASGYAPEPNGDAIDDS